MKTKELADELMIWLPKLSAGKALEAMYKDGPLATTIVDVADLITFIKTGNTIRIKQDKVEEPKQVKCKQYWMVTSRRFWDGKTRTDMIPISEDKPRLIHLKSETVVRVVEPLPQDIVSDELIRSFPSLSDYHCDILCVLKELGMIKEELL